MAFVINAKKQRIVSQEHVERTRLKTLLCKGIPALTIKTNTCHNTSHHTCGHEPVPEEETNQSFGLVEGLVENLSENENIAVRDSGFLAQLADDNDLERNTVQSTNEEDLQHLMGKLLYDLIALCHLKGKLSITWETYVPHAKYFGREKDMKPDFCRIFNETGRSLLVVIVKSPLNKDILTDDKALGQICDYMLDAASYFGQRDVFGITTTVIGWKIHWFDHSSMCAAATNFLADESKLLDEAPPLLSRKLCSTRIYSYDDPQLIPLLLSVLGKAYTSGYCTVPLIDPHRMYVHLNTDGWCWKRVAVMDADNIQAPTINMQSNMLEAEEFTVLRHFVRTTEKLVWLALAGESRTIIVIKQYEVADSDAGIPEREAALWAKINCCLMVSVRRVRGLQALLTPLVFTASIDAARKVTIETDLSRWCYQPGGAPGDQPPSLHVINEQIREATSMWSDARAVARQALQRVANACIVHEDIEWRHFALLPVFSENDVIRMEPIMIDYADYLVVDNPATAMQIMTPKLDKLIADAVWV